MNILGYFNIDMAGYLQPGSYIHTDLIGPASAGELKQFYRDVCAIYIPEFTIEAGALSGGDSDHTSFNNNGYQGIFPFEDSQNYSPYIHTSSDIVGLSVNNLQQHMMFVQATLASVVSMADMLPAPQDLTAMAGDGEVVLEWTGVDSVEYYNIYRNGDPMPYATAPEMTFTDQNVTNGETYSYYVTATFLNSGEESGPSNPVTVVPMPPIAFPFYDDFETGGPYWTYEGSWGLRSGVYHSADYAMTESPSGNYQANLNISSTLRALNLVGATTAEMSFWTRYRIESGYDYMYVEVSTDGTNWDQLGSFTGNQNTWILKTYPLNNYLDEPNVIIRFRFFSDVYVEDDGMYIDDIEIDVSGVGIGEGPAATGRNLLHVHPNPAGNYTTVDYLVPQNGPVRMELTDASGKILKVLVEQNVNAGTYTLQADLSDLANGLYYLSLENVGKKSVRKVMVSR
jgi:bacillopeptidase F